MKHRSRASITQRLDLLYLNGATAHEFQVGRVWFAVLKFRYWFWPRRSRLGWQYPHILRFGLDPEFGETPETWLAALIGTVVIFWLVWFLVFFVAPAIEAAMEQN